MKKCAALTLLLVWFASLIAGCQSATATPASIDITDIQITVQPAFPTLEPYIFRTSEPGRVTIHGMLWVRDPVGIFPRSDDGLFLVPIVGETVSTIPQFVEGEVPQADYDERTGEFVFTDIEPGLYAVVVLTENNTQIPVSRFHEGGLAFVRVTDAQQNQTIELGDLSLP